MIDFYGDVGTFDAYPPAVQDKVITQTATNILDWDSGYAEFPVQPDFAAVNVPTLVICGNASHLAMQPIAGGPPAPGPTHGVRWCQPFHGRDPRCGVDSADTPAHPRSANPLTFHRKSTHETVRARARWEVHRLPIRAENPTKRFMKVKAKAPHSRPSVYMCECPVRSMQF